MYSVNVGTLKRDALKFGSLTKLEMKNAVNVSFTYSRDLTQNVLIKNRVSLSNFV